MAATFHAVFPDSILWLEPPAGTGILLGRLPGAPEPLGERWPGFYREPRLPLSVEAILAAVVLDPAGMARYAERGAIITDDNQLLAYGRLRGELLGGRFRFVKEHNQAIIHEIGAVGAPGRGRARGLSRAGTSGPAGP